MSRRFILLPLLLTLLVPGVAAAQGVGVGLGGRVGTLGLGGEVALGVNERVVFRGGIGWVPWEPTLTLGDVDVQLSLPTVYNVGVDLYLNGAMRVGGGVLFRSSDPEVSASFTGLQDIGGTTFTDKQLGTLIGVLDARDQAPYVLIGFGRHTSSRAGLFVDFGAVFVGEPDLRLNTVGGTLSDQEEPLRGALDREAAEFHEDIGGYLKILPIFSLGFRFGAG